MSDFFATIRQLIIRRVNITALSQQYVYLRICLIDGLDTCAGQEALADRNSFRNRSPERGRYIYYHVVDEGQSGQFLLPTVLLTFWGSIYQRRSANQGAYPTSLSNLSRR